MSRRFPGKQFSFLRLFIAFVVLAATAAVGVFGWTYTQQNMNTADRWFGGYIDVTATPSYEFESAVGSSYRNLVLSFLVSSGGRCEPSWGGFYSLQEAAESLDLDRRISRAEGNGYETVLSFGGQLNESLAAACSSKADLADAYRAAIDRYDAAVIDLDIEGEDLTDHAGLTRRVHAVKQLQDEATARNETLGVWLTLPADRRGLTADGVKAVRDYVEADVVLSGVNLMVMNFNVPSSETSQAALSIEALQSAHAQMRNLFWLHGDLFSNEQLWRRLGATPMIGQNDFVNEVFTSRDARELRQFADEVGLGRLSMWSLNRDEPCDANYPNLTVVATFCSGVPQTSGEFSQILSDGLTGGASASAEETQQDEPDSSEIVEDDPETSPYPIWNKDAAYPEGTKVVWRGNVYESLWWNREAQPDEPSGANGSPWRLIGPVLPGERPIAEPELPADFYAAWSPKTVYHRGDRIMHEGYPYEAKWWTQGDSPDAGTADPGSSPWQRLTVQQIEELLQGE